MIKRFARWLLADEIAAREQTTTDYFRQLIDMNKNQNHSSNVDSRLREQNEALKRTNETLLKRNVELARIINGLSVQAIQQALEKILPKGG